MLPCAGQRDAAVIVPAPGLCSRSPLSDLRRAPGFKGLLDSSDFRICVVSSRDSPSSPATSSGPPRVVPRAPHTSQHRAHPGPHLGDTSPLLPHACAKTQRNRGFSLSHSTSNVHSATETCGNQPLSFLHCLHPAVTPSPLTRARLPLPLTHEHQRDMVKARKQIVSFPCSKSSSGSHLTQNENTGFPVVYKALRSRPL